jgi:4-hydroxythreonine-4-phosphate dehydrogenase
VNDSLPRIAVSMGDPRGIGPEVIAKALADPGVRESARWVAVGTREALQPAALQGVEIHQLDHPDPGELSFRCVQHAIDLALLPKSDPRRCAGLVTAPISKEAWAKAGHGEFPGHTELLAARCGVADARMMFHAPACAPHETTAASTAGLNVILVTTHVPLGRVPELLTVERIVRTIERGSDAMNLLGVARPRIGVCGLNPHAGEDGLLGKEDASVIAPALRSARQRGIDAKGPLPADTIFQRALVGPNHPAADFDLVVAMYHDQGLIPLKTLAWDRAVNLTVGLPFVRTSPDHGTAFDIAGRNLANPGSMKSAMRLAARLCGRSA